MNKEIKNNDYIIGYTKGGLTIMGNETEYNLVSEIKSPKQSDEENNEALAEIMKQRRLGITENQSAQIKRYAETEFEMNKIRYYNQQPNYEFPTKKFNELEKENGDIAEILFRKIGGDWIKEKAIPILRKLEADFIVAEPAYKEWAEEDSLQQDFEV